MVHYLKKLAAGLALLLCAATQAGAQYYPGLGPWLNTPILKTATYTVTANDCGSTIALGGGANYALVLNAFSTYPAQCVIVAVNNDSNFLKTVTISGQPTQTLQPFAALVFFNQGPNGGFWNWAALGGPVAGTWTPQLQFGGANVGMNIGSTGSQFGSWSRNGPLIHVDISVSFSGTGASKGSSTGNATIANIPLVASSGTVGVCSSGFWQNMSTITSTILGAISAGTQNIQLFNTNSTTVTALTQGNFTNNSQFFMACDYHAY